MIVAFEPDDFIGIAQFRLSVLEQEKESASFWIGNIEYRLNEYGNYIDKIYPEREDEWYDLTQKIILAQIAKRKKARESNGSL